MSTHKVYKREAEKSHINNLILISFRLTQNCKKLIMKTDYNCLPVLQRKIGSKFPMHTFERRNQRSHNVRNAASVYSKISKQATNLHTKFSNLWNFQIEFILQDTG